MRAQPRWCVLPLLAAPVGTWALGLGDIELQSALNQPFQAQIALVSPTAEDLQGLSVTLANQATFERYGLDRPAFLSNLRFRVGRDNAGRDVILINSNESITEPFVTMLVEATWPSGRSLREYTVLLDPPLLLPEPAVQAPVQPAQSRAPEAAAPGGPIQRPAPQPAPQASPPPPRPQASPPPASVSDGSNYGPVQRSQTLWGIASQLQPSGVSINQMMLAIFQANPQAFDNNINLLRAGAVLRIPSAAEVGSISAANATAEVQRQTDAWRGRGAGEQQARLRLVPPNEDPGGAVQPTGAANAGEVASLRGELSATQAELEESRRLLELRNQELQQLQNQLAEARAAESAGADAAVEPPPAAADPGVDLEVEVEEPVFADEPVEAPVAEAETPAPAVTPAATRTPAAVTTTPTEPSLVSRILDIVRQPFVLIGVGVGVLLLAALLFLRRRRDDDVEDVTGRWEALEAEVEAEDEEIAATTRLRKRAEADDDFVVVEGGRDEDEDGSEDAAAALLADSEIDEGDDFARTRPPEASDETLSSQTVINLDQADPVAEADFHMAYGLYDQAAELVSKALEVQPNNRGLKLKLLEVFFVWGNKEAFLDAAQAFRDEMGDRPDADWDKVIIMGKQICPDEALFADATAAAGEVDLDLEAGDSEPALDLAFDEQSSADEETGTHAAAAGDGLDLNFGGESDFGSEDLMLESTGERKSSEPDDEYAGVDLDDELDIGEQTSAGLEAALFGVDDDDDAASATTPDIDVDSLAVTQESPTVETQRSSLDDEDWLGVTMESPTVEAAGPEGDTVEMSAVGDDDDDDGESPTMESPTLESPTVESARAEQPRSSRPACTRAPTSRPSSISTIWGSTSRTSKIYRRTSATCRAPTTRRAIRASSPRSVSTATMTTICSRPRASRRCCAGTRKGSTR